MSRDDRSGDADQSLSKQPLRDRFRDAFGRVELDTRETDWSSPSAGAHLRARRRPRPGAGPGSRCERPTASPKRADGRPPIPPRARAAALGPAARALHRARRHRMSGVRGAGPGSSRGPRGSPQTSSPTTNGCITTIPWSRSPLSLRFPRRKWSTHTEVSTIMVCVAAGPPGRVANHRERQADGPVPVPPALGALRGSTPSSRRYQWHAEPQRRGRHAGSPWFSYVSVCTLDMHRQVAAGRRPVRG